MTGSIEAVGSLVEGGMLARTVEPTAGEGDEGHTHEGACLNCGKALVGPHCHRCGQRAHVHRTLGAFFHDFLHGVFHFEGKTWRTIPLLAWRPGKLTREYIDGRRASYVSPIALFLFATFLLFAVFHAIGNPLGLVSSVEIDGKHQSLGEAERTLGAQLATLEAQRKAAVAAHKPTAAIDDDIAGTRSTLSTIRALHSGDLTQLASQAAAPPPVSGGVIGRAWAEVKSNPQLVFFKLQTNAYKYSWLLIPISVPFVWLLFAWQRRYGLYDHTVFVTYSLSFMTLALTLMFAFAAIGLRPLGAAMAIYAPFHMYRQLRETYGLGLGGALVRTALLVAFSWVALTLWTMALLVTALD